MCFSAEASFAAGAVLLGVGAVTLRAAKRAALLPFAAMPILFGVQQLSEGLVWQRLVVAPWGRSDSPVSELFLFFALFLWPFWMPFATFVMEPEPRRRRWLAGLSVMGFGVGAYLMACAAFRPEYACIAQQHIYYGVQIDPAAKLPINVAYLFAIVAPLLISSVEGTTAFGVAGFCASALAAIFFKVGYASVWCFFAAALSVMVHRIVKRASAAPDHSSGSRSHFA